MKKKITLKKFFESKEELCIHCDTKEKAIALLDTFSRIGKTWVSGNSYLGENKWDCYKSDTCYSNKGYFGPMKCYEDMHYIIYEFEEVDLESSDSLQGGKK